MIPEFHMIDIASHLYNDINGSMTFMRELSSILLLGSISATLVILGLIIFLILFDRKSEFAIYFVLGEKRKNVIFQFVIETAIVSFFSISTGLLIGNYFSNQISTEILRRELNNQAQQFTMRVVHSDSPENLGFRHYVSHEEMIALFDTTLNGASIALIYIITFGIIFVMTSLSACYILKVGEKNILAKSSIG